MNKVIYASFDGVSISICGFLSLSKDVGLFLISYNITMWNASE